ncbi:MAG: hypothetical protein AAF518_06430 [Spirochaetota bacterium]
MKHIITEKEINQAVADGKSFDMRCYTVTSAYLKNLEIIIRNILQKYEKANLFPAIFGVIQELNRWSSIANMRYLFFHDNGLDLKDGGGYQKHEADFLSTINTESILGYREKLKKQDMYIRSLIKHNEHGLHIEVFNHSKTILSQEAYLRDYLRRAMSYTDIMEYFEDHPEDKQGRAMGLAFSIILLKEAGLRPELLRLGKVSSSGGYSRIEIPFDESYRSIRDKILNDEPIIPFENTRLVPPEYEKQLQEKLSQMQQG